MIKHRNNGLGFKWNYWKAHLEIEDTLFHKMFIGEDMICQPNRFFVKNGIKLFDRGVEAKNSRGFQSTTMANLTDDDDDDDRYVAITNRRHNWQKQCHSTTFNYHNGW